MKTIRSFTRSQIALAACGLALVGLLAIIPWQVVAQDSKPTTKPPALPGVESQVDPNSTKKPPVEPGAKADNSKSKQTAASEKLLIGTWRGGPSGSDVLTIQKDGSYTWLFRTDGQGIAQWPTPHVRNGAGAAAPGRPGAAPPAMGGFGGGMARGTYSNNSGRWKLDGDTLVLVYSPTALVLRGFSDMQPGMGAGQATDQWPTDFTAAGNVYTGRMSIVRVDDSLLRLMGLVPSEQRNAPMMQTAPKFFKRVDNQAATPKFAAEVPKELQQIAQLACLNAAEADYLTKWVADENKGLKAMPADAPGSFTMRHPESLPLDALERVSEARAGKIDFAELFHLSAEEAAAYREVNKLAGGCGAVVTLAGQGQLTPLEHAALHKLLKFRDAFGTIGTEIVNGANNVPTFSQYGAPASGEPAGAAPTPGGGFGGFGAAPGADPAGGAAPGPLAADPRTVAASPTGEAGASEADAAYLVRQETFYKLQTLFIELDSWLNSTVFN